MKYIYYFGGVLLILLLPFLAITGFDIVGFDSGGGITSDPAGEGSTFGDEEAIVIDGAGGDGGITISEKISLDPTEFNIELITNTNTRRTITVTNLEFNTKTLSINQENLDNMIILGEESLSLGIRESKNFDVIFVALNDTGIFTGKISIGDEEIPVSLNIRSKLLLFDSNIIVLNANYLVRIGGNLKTRITLIPLGDEERLDVTLNYVIKDFEGNVYFTKSETLLVEKKVDLRRDFDLGTLGLGKYIIGLELVYPNGIATSSAQFEIVDKLIISLGNIVYYILVSILINLILIVTLLINRIYQSK